MRCWLTMRWLRANLPSAGDPLPPRIDAHLARCEVCRAGFARLQLLAQALASLATPEPPLGLRAEVLGTLPKQRRRLSALLPVAAAAAVLILSVHFLQRPPASPPLVQVSSLDLDSGSYVQQHLTLAVADPLADPSAANAASLLVMPASAGWGARR